MPVIFKDVPFTITASGNSSLASGATVPQMLIPAEPFHELIVQVNVTNNLLGSAATVKFGLDTTIDGTNWTKLGVQANSVSSAGMNTLMVGTGATGASADFTADSALSVFAAPFGDTVRVNWTLAATTGPSCDFLLSAYGK